MTINEQISILDQACSLINSDSALQIIGNNIWYNDEAYPLYNPIDYKNGPYFEPFRYLVFEKQHAQIIDFNWAGAIGNMSLEGEESPKYPYSHQQGAGLALINLGSILTNNLSSKNIELALYTNEAGQNRGVVLIGSSNDRKAYSVLSGETTYYVSGTSGLNYALRLEQVENLYERITGEKEEYHLFRTLDIELTVDPKHKYDVFSGYVVGEENGNLLIAPIVYEGDSASMIRHFTNDTIYDFTEGLDSIQIVEGGKSSFVDLLNDIARRLIK